jgi:hypothetical protein
LCKEGWFGFIVQGVCLVHGYIVLNERVRDTWIRGPGGMMLWEGKVSCGWGGSGSGGVGSTVTPTRSYGLDVALMALRVGVSMGVWERVLIVGGGCSPTHQWASNSCQKVSSNSWMPSSSSQQSQHIWSSTSSTVVSRRSR